MNTISKRTRNFDPDVNRAIAKRGQYLLRQYTGFNGLYQTSEQMTEREIINRRRINRSVNNTIRNYTDLCKKEVEKIL